MNGQQDSQRPMGGQQMPQGGNHMNDQHDQQNKGCGPRQGMGGNRVNGQMPGMGGQKPMADQQAPKI